MNTKDLDILIVEDDLSFAIELEMLLEKLGYNPLGRVDNSAQALEMIIGKEPDLILMDVDIKGQLSGVEIAQKIKHLNIPILFITSHDDELVYQEAQKSNMIGYLVKPLSSFTLKSAVDAIIKSLSFKPATSDADQNKETSDDFVFKDYLFFKKRDEYKKVKLHDIGYFESDNNYVNVYVADEKLSARITLKELQELLPKNQFMQVHRSVVVNLNKIDAFNFQTNKLKIAGVSIDVSRANRDIILDLLPKLK